MKIHVLCVAIALAGLAGAASDLRAQSSYTSGHGDIGIEYVFGESPTTFEPHWHLHEEATYDGITIVTPGGEEFAPGDLIAVTMSTDTATSAVASALGVTAGSSIFRMGSDLYEPELGFGTEELVDSDWLDGGIVLTLTGFSGEGEVAIFSGAAPSALLLFSSLNPAITNGNNAFNIGAGSHFHFPVYFSKAGDYLLTFSWSGTYIGAGAPVGGIAVSGADSFQLAAVPEPGAWGVLMAVGLGLIIWSSRRKARATS